MITNNGNYRIQVTLVGAKLHQAKMLVDSLTKDYDLDVKEFTVEAFQQNPDFTDHWEAIGFDEYLENPHV